MKNSGNALFLILIAVALFAALSYAITQSGRGGGGLGREQTLILAAQITSSASMVKQGVQRMLLTGTPVADIFCVDEGSSNGSDCGTGSVNNGGNGRSFCTTGSKCLFAAEGGGIQLPDMPAAAYDIAACTNYSTRFTDATGYRGFIIDGFNADFGSGNPGNDTSVEGFGGTDNDDIFFAFCLKEDVCRAINRGLGIDGIPVIDDWNPLDDDPGAGNSLANVEQACVDTNVAAVGFGYYVVLNGR